MKQITPPQVSIVLGTYNRLSFLKSTIASVRASQIDVPYEIIVVDGGSKDGTIEWLTAQGDIISIVQHNREVLEGKACRKRSWGYFMNLGFKCAEGRYICLISDDSVIHPDTLANGVRRFDREIAEGRRIGALAFYWRSWPEEQKYRACLTLGSKMMVNHGLFLRDVVEKVGWIDDARYGFYCADGDLSLKIWEAGYEIDVGEDALLEHFERADPAIRQQNLSGLDSDWKNYLERWTNIFYDPSNPDIGVWIHLDGVAVRDADHIFPNEALLDRVVKTPRQSKPPATLVRAIFRRWRG
jgi:glycosyltransferase involved in cell wall biosynthesis